MARLPSRYDISQPISGRSGRAIASVDTSGLARGVQSLGASLADIGAQFKKDEVTTDIVGADGPATRELHDLERTFDEDGDYSTFSKRAEQGLATIKGKYAQRIRDPRARQAWEADFDKSAETSRNRIADLGERKVREGRLVEAKNGLQSYQSLIADNTLAEADRGKAKATAEASIAALRAEGLLSPNEADQWREDVINGGDFLYGQREIERNGTAALGAGDIVSKIIGVESGGNPNAKNPNSSATGLGQFIASTWMQTVREHRPDLLEGRTAKEVLDLRKDGALSREMTGYLVQDNASFLKNQGVVPTNGDLYLAHFLGPRGAAQILKADPGASVASVVGQDAVNANSFLKGMNAADVRAWAEKKMGGSGRPDWYTSQPADKQLQLENMAASRDREVATADAAQRKAESSQANDDYRLRISTADPTLTQQQILSDGRIDNGQKATLLNSFNEKTKDEIAIGQAVKSFANGDLGNTVDPYSADGRKVVDGLQDRIAKLVPEDQQGTVTDDLIRQSGVVPSQTFNAIRRGLSSTNISEVEAAAQQAQRISTINPAALGRRDGGGAVQGIADDFSYYVNKLNLTPAEAAARIAEQNDPTKVRERKVLEPAAKEFRKQIEQEDVADLFDDSWLDDPQVGFNAQQALGIQADYLAIAEEQFYKANGDPELAKNRASEQMQRLYGVTRMTGTPVVMKHPPERYWPGRASNSWDAAVFSTPHQYAEIQLNNDIRAIDPQADFRDVQFVATPETDAMIKRGEMPAYQVMYTDENGLIQTIPGKLWAPDFKQVVGANENLASERATKNMERALDKQIDERGRAEIQNSDDGGRALSLEQFLSGPEAIPLGENN